jgi:thiamine pyrophosphate-dependent acetolactate synthase large subunit-like protein
MSVSDIAQGASMAAGTSGTLDRRVVMQAVLAARGEALIVTGLGSTTYDAGIADHPGTFYLWGAMGAAAMTGLGLALAQPNRRVVVLTGDGEMLMGFGAFATIGARAPGNFALAVINNGLYSETGMQPTHAGRGVDLGGVAKSCNFATVRRVESTDDLHAGITDLYHTPGPVFLDIRVDQTRYPLTIRLRDGVHIKNRFREHLLGEAAFD